jgi:hypothetical protein
LPRYVYPGKPSAGVLLKKMPIIGQVGAAPAESGEEKQKKWKIKDIYAKNMGAENNELPILQCADIFYPV